MGAREITSRENPLVKAYTKLAASRKERQERGQFVTEGIKLTWEAFQAGCGLERLFVTQAALERYEQIPRMDCRELILVSQPVADKLAQSVNPQGVFGVFSMLDKEKAGVKMEGTGRLLALSSLQDPGNVGTILRTAAALGVDGVLLSGDCPDPYSPKVLRSTMGGLFKVPWEICQDLPSKLMEAKGVGIPVYGAALTPDAQPIQNLSMEKGCLVVIGNEGNGLSQEVLDCCSQTAIIPMAPDSESLNAAMAAGIFIWEMTRNR